MSKEFASGFSDGVQGQHDAAAALFEIDDEKLMRVVDGDFSDFRPIDDAEVCCWSPKGKDFDTQGGEQNVGVAGEEECRPSAGDGECEWEDAPQWIDRGFDLNG